MVTVPRVSGPSVEYKAAPPSYQEQGSFNSSSAGGNGIASLNSLSAGLDKVGDVASTDALAWQTQDNERQAKDLDVQFRGIVSNITYGDGTADNPGFYSAQGVNALNAAPGAKQMIEQARQKLLMGTSNSAVKNMFDTASNYVQQSTFDGMDQHVGTQRLKANSDASNARMAMGTQGAIDAWNDPKKLDESLTINNAEIASMASQNGWDKATAALALQQKNSESVTGVIKNAVAAGNPDLAASVAAKYSSQITAADKPAITNLLQENIVLKESQTMAATITSQGGSLTSMLAKARASTSNPKLLEALNQQISEIVGAQRSDISFAHSQQEFAEHEQDRADEGIASKAAAAVIGANTAKDANGNTDYSGFDRMAAQDDLNDQNLTPNQQKIAEKKLDDVQGLINGNTYRQNQLLEQTEHKINVDYAEKQRAEKQASKDALHTANTIIANGGSTVDIAQQHPDVYDRVTADGQLGQLMAQEQRIAEGKPYADKSDGVSFNQVRALDPQELSQYDLVSNQGKFTSQEYNKLYTLVNSAKNSVEQATSKSGSLYSFADDKLKDYGWQGWNTSKESDDQVAARQAALNEMHAWIDQYTTEGKIPSTADIDKKAIQLMLPVTAQPKSTFLGIPYNFSIDTKDRSPWQGIVAQARQMNDTQRSVARVEYEDIPNSVLDNIEISMKQSGLDINDHDLVEQIAGATAMQDRARLKQLGIKLSGN